MTMGTSQRETLESQNRTRKGARNNVTTISSKNVRNVNQLNAENSFNLNNEDNLLPENIKLEANEVDLAAIKEIDGYKEIRYKDAIYMGTVINGKRHGKGVMKYRNGRQYEGFWEHDLRDGKGFERYPNGNTYFGQFKFGKAHGKGVYTWKNGEVYDGEWN